MRGGKQERGIMRKPVELEDIESALYALRQAQEPMVKFSLDRETTKDRAIVVMQDAIRQALACLERICSEASRHE